MDPNTTSSDGQAGGRDREADPVGPRSPHESKPASDAWLQTVWVCLVVAVLYTLTMRPYLGHNSDGGIYLDGARSLAAGNGYRFGSFSGKPPIGLYPPGTSLLFIPAMWVAHDIDTQIVGCLLLLGLVTAVGIHVVLRLLIRLGVPSGLAGLVTLAMITSPHWFLSIASLGSDVPFAVVVWIGCLWWIRESGRDTVTGLLPVAALLFLAQLIRSAGLALFVGVIVAELVLNRRRAIRSIPLFAGAWLAAKLVIGSISTPGGLGYVGEWKRFIESSGGIQWYWQHLLENFLSFLLGGQFHELVWPIVARSHMIASRYSETAGGVLRVGLVALWMASLALMVAPLVRHWRMGRDRGSRHPVPLPLQAVTLLIVAGSTVGMLVVVPNKFTHFPRYLLWTSPFLFVALWRGISSEVPRHWHRAVMFGSGLVVCAVIASNAWISTSILRQSIANHGVDEGREFATEVGKTIGDEPSVAVSGLVPYIHFSERLRRPLFASFYERDLSTSPPVDWSDRARRCVFVITHQSDDLEDLAKDSGWTMVARSASGKYTLYRTKQAEPR